MPRALHVLPNATSAVGNLLPQVPHMADALGRLLRVADVIEETSLSRTTLWRMVKAGTFPAPNRIGTNRIAWPESRISAWKHARLNEPPG